MIASTWRVYWAGGRVEYHYSFLPEGFTGLVVGSNMVIAPSVEEDVVMGGGVVVTGAVVVVVTGSEVSLDYHI